MKQFIRHTRLFGWLAAAALLLTTSCKDELFGDNGRSDEVTVTFNLTPEAATTVVTRADGDSHVDYANKPRISDGSKADMLIYAVYDKDDNLLTGYSEGTDEALKDRFEHGDGQTIKKIDKFPTTVTLTLKRGETYKIAFWAQSSQCKAYDTKDLKKVEVIYSSTDAEVSTLNNDEMRDAFCRSVEIVAGADGSMEKNVYLYRPLAQINVGTYGYDFESATRNANQKYLYSRIRLNRVARYLDVVEDKTYSSTTDAEHSHTGDKTPEAFAVVDFGYAPIPAYVNMAAIPGKPSYTIWDWDYATDEKPFAHPDGMGRDAYAKEEFLKVHLHRNESDQLKKEDGLLYTNDIDNDGYLDYANLSNYPERLTETFKYLSMCYVLTSSTKDEKILINNVKVWMATSDTPEDKENFDEIEIVNLNNVPAQRNWRTNIVGNMLTEKNSFEVKLDKDFAGEYNGWAAGDEYGDWKDLTGPIAKGVYYDAENDEIQISDVDGLLWFQRMVNGDMKVRFVHDFANVKVKVGDSYHYYEASNPNERIAFEYDVYKAADYDNDPMLKARILKATHQDQRKDSPDWPANNNFHFAGAKVKLMADIDLTGIEWIPIGMDYKIAELKRHYENEDAFLDKEPTNRGFYGTFDGNNHTISNLKTKRFSAKVDDDYCENNKSSDPFNYDVLPWLSRGLFGSIGGDATIKNVRLYNVDILGCQGVGGIVGVAYGNDITIENCIVDTGELTATPMYRNDTDERRTFARGVYLGGIAGYFYTNGGIVKKCTVSNLVLKGYRRAGGLLGSIDYYYDSNSKATKGNTNTPAEISGNSMRNTVIIASQLHFPFGISPANESGSPNELGFGWDAGGSTGGKQYDLYSGEWIGGDADSYLEKTYTNYIAGKGNTSIGVTYSPMVETVTGGKRISSIHEVPLHYMPALSSWFTDEITLNANYYGSPSAHTKYNIYEFAPKNTLNPGKYYYPMLLPLEVQIAWDEKSPNVGVYVESVKLDGNGENSIGGRSVITPTDVAAEGACCMYVTARDRQTAGSLYTDRYAQPTEISNVVLRGSPYAYTGLLLAPNENMRDVKLNNVAIYDVYQTLALDKITSDETNKWPQSVSAESTTLTVDNCNLRGYTVPGEGWKKITYTTTTFEQGLVTDNGVEQAQTCKVADGVETMFTGCYFKAPYIIDLSDVKDLSKVKFTNCYATAASKNNKKIDLSGYSSVKKIEIKSDVDGNPVVEITE